MCYRMSLMQRQTNHRPNIQMARKRQRRQTVSQECESYMNICSHSVVSALPVDRKSWYKEWGDRIIKTHFSLYGLCCTAIRTPQQFWRGWCHSQNCILGREVRIDGGVQQGQQGLLSHLVSLTWESGSEQTNWGEMQFFTPSPQPI